MHTDLRQAPKQTIAAYDRMADAYADDAQHRDLSADYALFLGPFEGRGPLELLDLGCGPGRDLRYFASLGHRALGIDGSARFVAMAQAASGCRVLKQNLLKLRLPAQHFDGIFACASLFHVPPEKLPDVLRALHRALKPRGVLFTLNPRGRDEQGWVGDRFCCYYRLATWRRRLKAAGFHELAYAYRPLGLPRARQQWVSTVWRRKDAADAPGFDHPRGRGL